MTNSSHTVLYTGVTNDLARRVEEHKSEKGSKFTSKYKAHILVYAEEHQHIQEAISREKQIKGGSRANKLLLINDMNPEWKDLCEKLW